MSAPRLARRLRRAAEMLRPSVLFASVPGPLFLKEAQLIGRRPSTYWTRGAASAVLLVLISILFVVLWFESTDQSAASRLQQLQIIAPSVTIAVLWFTYVILPVCALGINAGAICEERRKGTLSALLTTPLAAWQILLGKIAGQSVQLIVIALLGAPLLLAVRVFGGVGPQTIIIGYALAVSSALLAATLAAWHSIHSRKASTAMLAAMLSFALIQCAPPVLFLLMSHYGIPGARQWHIFLCSPIAMFAVSAELFGSMGIPVFARSAATLSAAYALAWSVLIYLISCLHLRWYLRREAGFSAPAAATVIPDPAPTPGRKTRRPAHRSAPRVSRDVGDHPVLWRELRQSVFKSRRNLIIVALAIAALFIYLYFEAGIDERNLHTVVTAIASMILLCSAAAVSSGSLSGERESRTLDSLLSTPLSAFEIISGKFAGAFRRLWFIPAVIGTHFTLSYLAGVVRPILLLHLALILIPPAAAVCASGVWFSTLFSKSTTAAAVNMALAFGFWLGLPLMVGFTIDTMTTGRMADDILEIMFMPNPVPIAVVAAGGGVIERGTSTLPYPMLSLGRLSTFWFTAYTCVHAMVYAFFTLVFLWLATRRLASSSGRSLW